MPSRYRDRDRAADRPMDAWLPGRTRPSARTTAAAGGADPDALWDAAPARVRLSDTRSLGRLVRWRIPGLARRPDLRRAVPRLPVHGARGGRARCSSPGLCGRIWTLARDYPRLAGAGGVRARWDEPGTVRVLFAHWVAPDGDGRRRAGLARRACSRPTASAALRLRALWTVIGPVRAPGRRRAARAGDPRRRARRQRSITACVTGTPKRCSASASPSSSR